MRDSKPSRPNHPETRAHRWATALLACALAVPVAWSVPGDLSIPRSEGSMSVQSMPASIFPHWLHRIRYRCDACHSELFEMKLGASDISMERIAKGESCGTCHNGETAFKPDFQGCGRCHRPVDS